MDNPPNEIFILLSNYDFKDGVRIIQDLSLGLIDDKIRQLEDELRNPDLTKRPADRVSGELKQYSWLRNAQKDLMKSMFGCYSLLTPIVRINDTAP